MFGWLKERAGDEGKYIPNTLFIFMELMKSENFREQFFKTCMEQIERVYHPSKVISRISAIQTELEEEMELQAERCGMSLINWH